MLTPFYFLLSSSYFHFKLCFLLLQLFSILQSYYFSPVQTLRTNFLVNGYLTFFPTLKNPHSLSTFSNLCSLVVDRVVIAAFFSMLPLDLHYSCISSLKFYCSPLLLHSALILPILFFFLSQILTFPCLNLVFIPYS